LTTDPHVVGDSSEGVVPRVGAQDGAEAVLEVVSTTSLETYAVDIKPGTPEDAPEPVDMTCKIAAGVVSEAEIDAGLNVEVDDTDEARGGEKVREGVDDGVEVGLSVISKNSSIGETIHTIIDKL
jgi:hypothetical protein